MKYDRRSVLGGIGCLSIGTLLTGASAIGTASDTDNGVEELWSTDLVGDDSLHSSPTVTEDTVYINGVDGGIYALDAEDGEIRWEVETNRGIRTSPTVAENTVFVSGTNLHALHPETGEELWLFEPGAYGMTGSPVVFDKTVYASYHDGAIYAVDAVSGEEVWIHETKGHVESSPTVVDGTVYVGTGTGPEPDQTSLLALDAETGDLEWEFETGGSVTSSPTVYDGTVYVGSWDLHLYALDADGGTEKWSFEATSQDYEAGEHGEVEIEVGEFGNVRSSPTVHDGVVYFTSDNGYLFAVDAADGEKLWMYQPRGFGLRTAATVVDDTVFLGPAGEDILAVDAETGDMLWEFSTPGPLVSASTSSSSPTVRDGVLFVGSTDGKAYALDVGVSGSSEDSRIEQETLGHLATVDGEPIADGDTAEGSIAASGFSGSDDDDGGDGGDDDEDSLPAPGIAGTAASIAGAGYLLYRRSNDDT